MQVRGAYSEALEGLSCALSTLDTIMLLFSSTTPPLPSSASASSTSHNTSSSLSTTKTHSNEQSNEEEEASAQSRLENVLHVLLKNFFRCSRKNILHDRISFGKIVPKKIFPSGKNVLPWLLSFKNILRTFGLEKLTSLTASILSGMMTLIESYVLMLVVLSVQICDTFFFDSYYLYTVDSVLFHCPL
jgi:hypothetical protein